MTSEERTGVLVINGLRLFRREWGSRDAPAIVLLHGLRGFSNTWRTLASALSSSYRLIAIDQRGRGQSDWDPECGYYTDAYLSDLEAVVNELRLQRFALIGHSMGGTTSYVYADRHPERLAALIIEDIAPGSSAGGAGAQRVIDEMRKLPDGFPSWDAARNYWRALRPTVSDDALEQRISESLKEASDGRIVWRYDAAGISRTRMNPDPARVVDLWPVVERIRVPTLVIRGARSDFCPPDVVATMCRRNPRISAVTLESATHYVHDDAPEAFARCVLEFLQRHYGTPAHGDGADPSRPDDG